jgi:hypothetical protein
MKDLPCGTSRQRARANVHRMRLDESKFHVFATVPGLNRDKLTNNQLNEEEYKVYKEQDEDPAALGESHRPAVLEYRRRRREREKNQNYLQQPYRMVFEVFWRVAEVVATEVDEGECK